MNKKYPNAISREKQREVRGYKGGGWGLAKEGRGSMHEAAPSNKKEEKVFPETWFHLS